MKKTPLITIFTPTYNRAQTLVRLYNSLLNQTYKNFEWIIVDDGSIDTTESLIFNFIKEGRVNAKYVKQENGGKHRAINRGVQKAIGELFFIVDSDDILPNDSTFKIKFYYDKIKENSNIAGVVGLKCYLGGETVGTEIDQDEVICNLFDYRYRYKVKGDRAEVIRTEIMQKYPFPEIECEKFVAESIVWNRIANDYKLLYFNKNIYMCEYLDDGLSAKSVQLRMQNPIGACLLYGELSKANIPKIIKLKAIINYWRFSFCTKKTLRQKVKEIGMINIIWIFVSYLFHIKDCKMQEK
jgi:glycosyltransferase involved in cell wall biosynthesis